MLALTAVKENFYIMDIMNIILIISGVAIGVFVIIYIIALLLASKSIFHGSGAPIDMANVVLQSILAAGQIIVGIAILTIITVLITTGKISKRGWVANNSGNNWLFSW